MTIHHACVAVALSFGMVGCQPAGNTRLQVEGTVRVNGKALVQGTVIFNPTDVSRQGGPVQAAVQTGRYRADVVQGKYRVTFAVGSPEEGALSSDRVAKAGTPPIARRYRDGIEVEVQEPTTSQDFDLTCR